MSEMSPQNLEARLGAFRPQVRRHIRALVKDRADAEDLTQETYARAIAHLEQLRDPQAALAWLYRIATNVALDRLRARRPPIVPLTDGTELHTDDRTAVVRSELATALEQSEMSACVEGYLEQLPDDYRVAILLRDVHDLTNVEVAELLGCSLATAKIRVHRARLRLRESLAAACAFEADARGVIVCEPR
jgi:RNA polymerase sigma-70 factor, ECF subfamily